jgi:hypothetical protein
MLLALPHPQLSKICSCFSCRVCWEMHIRALYIFKDCGLNLNHCTCPQCSCSSSNLIQVQQRTRKIGNSNCSFPNPSQSLMLQSLQMRHLSHHQPRYFAFWTSQQASTDDGSLSMSTESISRHVLHLWVYVKNCVPLATSRSYKGGAKGFPAPR